MPDWKKIKKEYIATDISQRALAKKYGVAYSPLARRCRDEKWVELRAKADSKADALAVEAAAKANSAVDIKLHQAAELLVEKAIEGIMATPADDALSMQAYGRVLKSAMDVLGAKSPADMAEQEARIAKLRRDAAQDGEKENTAQLVISGLPEGFEV